MDVDALGQSKDHAVRPTIEVGALALVVLDVVHCVHQADAHCARQAETQHHRQPALDATRQGGIHKKQFQPVDMQDVDLVTILPHPAQGKPIDHARLAAEIGLFEAFAEQRDVGVALDARDKHHARASCPAFDRSIAGSAHMAP